MKKILAVALVAAGLLMTNTGVKAQTKIGYVSLQDLIPSMPEYKKADSSMVDYQNALGQQFEDMRREFGEQDSLLNSKDTVKFTKAQLELKRKNLGDMYGKIQTFQQQSQQMMQQKQQEL